VVKFASACQVCYRARPRNPACPYAIDMTDMMVWQGRAATTRSVISCQWPRRMVLSAREVV